MIYFHPGKVADITKESLSITHKEFSDTLFGCRDAFAIGANLCLQNSFHFSKQKCNQLNTPFSCVLWKGGRVITNILLGERWWLPKLFKILHCIWSSEMNRIFSTRAKNCQGWVEQVSWRLLFPEIWLTFTEYLESAHLSAPYLFCQMDTTDLINQWKIEYVYCLEIRSMKRRSSFTDWNWILCSCPALFYEWPNNR